MIGQITIARALPGFNDLGRSVTPTFLLMDHFLYWFSTFREKMKIYRLEVWIFGKMHHRIPFSLGLRACVRRFQMPLKRLNFVKTSVTFGIIYPTDPLLQNIIKIVCLRWLTFDIFNFKPLSAQLYGTIFRNQYSLPLSETKTVTPIFFFFFFFCISGTSNSLSAWSKNVKKLYRLENFRANVLKLLLVKIWIQFRIFDAWSLSGWRSTEKSNAASVSRLAFQYATLELRKLAFSHD